MPVVRFADEVGHSLSSFIDESTPPMLLANLPADVVALVLVQLGRGKGRASDIARVAPTCSVLRAAARAAEKAHRRVCFEYGSGVRCVAAAPDAGAEPPPGTSAPPRPAAVRGDATDML